MVGMYRKWVEFLERLCLDWVVGWKWGGGVVEVVGECREWEE